jgi:hypothetical protein
MTSTSRRFLALLATIATCSAWAAGPVSPDGDAAAPVALSAAAWPSEGGGEARDGKSITTGIYMSGSWTYTLNPGAAGGPRAYVTLGAINNTSLIGYVTGTLRLELWATTTPPAYQGASFFGQRLAIFPNNGQLAPGYSFYNISTNAGYTIPSYGTYWIVLMLAEYLPGYCGNADAFCMVDNVTASQPVAIGNSLLSVSRIGTGAGTVTGVQNSPSPSSVINCGATCSANLFGGYTVTLTATPAPGSTFSGWSGACAGTGTCTVDMTSARSVAATFTVIPAPSVYLLTVSTNGTGAGAVTSSPNGIHCGNGCTANYNDGTVVTLQATPSAGSLFAGWSGACAGTANCSVTMNMARSVTATFNLDPAGDSDGDGIPNGVEPNEGRNPLAKDNDVFSFARLFAMQQYRDFLGREGDAAGITGWTNLLNAGTYTRAQAINAFFNSPEFNGFVAPVVRLYFATFLRVPDYGGLVGNAALVRNGTVTLTQLADFFVASPEFAATYGSLDNAQFVTLLYQNVLGRAPDAAGLNGWVSLLNAGTHSRGQVLLGFSESPEYQAALFNEVYVTMMYVAMLRRSPEPGGFNGWLAYLDTPGNTPLAMIDGFYLAAEYRARFLP